MKKTLIVVFFGALAVFAAATTSVLAADTFAGAWKLNVAKSKYSPGPAPKSNLVKFESIAGGLRLTADGVDSQGKKTHNEYTAKFDGKDYPTKPMLDGKPNPTAADGVSYKTIDDYTFEVTNKLKGKVLTVSKNVFSRDGKTRTVTTTGVNAQGQKENDVVVFDKQ